MTKNQKTQSAFILGQRPFTDHQILVSCYGQETGLLRAICRMTKKDFLHSAFVPFNKVTAQFSGKPHADLKRMTQIQVDRQLFDFSSTYLSLCLLQHWAFLVEHSQGAGQQDEKIFRLLEHVSSYLQSNPEMAAFPAMNIYFEFWLLVLCGEFPRLRDVKEMEQVENGVLKLKNNQLVISTKVKCSESDTKILLKCFKQTIEQFVPNAIQYKVLSCLSEAAGFLWSSIIDKKLATRQILVDQFREKGFL